jgi:hypothetical protein
LKQINASQTVIQKGVKFRSFMSNAPVDGSEGLPNRARTATMGYLIMILHDRRKTSDLRKQVV